MEDLKIETTQTNLAGATLFNPNPSFAKNVAFNIPEYQRDYVWSKKDWQALFDDIVENSKGYFIGAIICVKQDGNNFYDVQEVVDGQQRLTTLSIFLAAIYESLSQHKSNFDDKQLSHYVGLRSQLAVECNGGKVRPRVFPQNPKDVNDYLQIMIRCELFKENELEYSEPLKKKIDERRLIPKAYKYFCKRIEMYADGSLDKIDELYARVSSTVLVKILAYSQIHANTLFETLNGRGVPLSVTDLIKNRLFAKLKKSLAEDKTGYEKSLKIWKNAVESVTHDDSGKELPSGEQERFFRHTYNAFRREWNDDKFVIGKRANLFELYEQMIELDCSRVLNQIAESSEIYQRLQGTETSGISSGLQKCYADLRRINGATSYTLLLYLVKNRKALGLGDPKFEEICRLLINFFVRHSFTNTPSSNTLDEIFNGFIGEIQEKSYTGAAIYENLKRVLQEKYKADAGDEKFKAALRETTFERGSNDNLRFVLVKLAEKPYEGAKPDFWELKATDGKIKKTSLVWTIEHILPQTLSDEWVEILAGGDKAEAEKIREEYVHRLGNLTLTQNNAQISNKLFVEKKKLAFDKDKFLNVDGGLNEWICAQTEWTPKKN